MPSGHRNNSQLDTNSQLKAATIVCSVVAVTKWLQMTAIITVMLVLTKIDKDTKVSGDVLLQQRLCCFGSKVSFDGLPLN